MVSSFKKRTKSLPPPKSLIRRSRKSKELLDEKMSATKKSSGTRHASEGLGEKNVKPLRQNAPPEYSANGSRTLKQSLYSVQEPIHIDSGNFDGYSSNTSHNDEPFDAMPTRDRESKQRNKADYGSDKIGTKSPSNNDNAVEPLNNAKGRKSSGRLKLKKMKSKTRFDHNKPNPTSKHDKVRISTRTEVPQAIVANPETDFIGNLQVSESPVSVSVSSLGSESLIRTKGPTDKKKPEKIKVKRKKKKVTTGTRNNSHHFTTRNRNRENERVARSRQDSFEDEEQKIIPRIRGNSVLSVRNRPKKYKSDEKSLSSDEKPQKTRARFQSSKSTKIKDIYVKVSISYSKIEENNDQATTPLVDSFQTLTSIIMQREKEMKSMAREYGIGSDRWRGSLLMRKLKKVKREKGTLSFLSKRKNYLEVTFDPKVEFSNESYDTNKLIWTNTLTECIKSYYDTGTIHVSDECEGNDVMLALEYFGIVYLPSQLTFDTFASYMRIKLWSDYYTYRDLIADWVVTRLMTSHSRHSHVFVTSPRFDGPYFVGNKECEIFDGGLKLGTDGSGSGENKNILSCSVIYEFFNNKDDYCNELVPNLDERSEGDTQLIRSDFCSHLLELLPGTNIHFMIRNVSKVPKSNDLHYSKESNFISRAVLYVDFDYTKRATSDSDYLMQSKSKSSVDDNSTPLTMSETLVSTESTAKISPEGNGDDNKVCVGDMSRKSEDSESTVSLNFVEGLDRSLETSIEGKSSDAKKQSISSVPADIRGKPIPSRNLSKQLKSVDNANASWLWNSLFSADNNDKHSSHRTLSKKAPSNTAQNKLGNVNTINTDHGHNDSMKKIAGDDVLVGDDVADFSDMTNTINWIKKCCVDLLPSLEEDSRQSNLQDKMI